MLGILSRPFRRRPLVLALVATALSACTTWGTPDVPLESLMSDPPSRIRLWVARTGRITLLAPRLDGDTLRGRGQFPGMPISVAVEDIMSVEVQRAAVGRTIAVVGATVLVVAAAVAAVSQTGNDRPLPSRRTPQDVSCPVLYSWDGEGWRLDSATFGGAIMPALARTDIDNLDHAVDENGRIRLRLANEMDETDHVDAVQLLAVDHDPGVSVAPGPDGRLRTIGSITAPMFATDLTGHDALERLATVDGWGWESPLRVRNAAAGSAELRDGLELEFRRPGAKQSAKLVLDANVTPWSAWMMASYVSAHGDETGAWYAALAADRPLAKQFGESLARQAFLQIEVQTDAGWVTQGWATEAGPELPKRQVIELDLTGVTGETVRVRMTAPPSLWRVDHVGIDYAADGAFDVQTVLLASALDAEGVDVAERLRAIDGEHLILETGDLYDLAFDVPPIPAGRVRTYLAQTHGWYRMHTSEEGEPDRELLRRVAEEPNAIAEINVERLNVAISALQDGGVR